MKSKTVIRGTGAWRRMTHCGLRVGGGALIAGAALAPEAALGADPTRIDRIERENRELRDRLQSLENVAQRAGILPSGQPAPRIVSSLSEISLSGMVQASYFYNSNEPVDQDIDGNPIKGASDGYLWNTTHNSFSINKVKLTLASKPVERSGDTWDAGFRVSMIWGEDAPVLNTGGERQGLEDLREAYIELNAPIGTGLNIRAGQLISLLNFESGDGGAVNPNFSQGYQWFFTGNGPAAGVQLGYTFTDWLDMKVRVQNGMYAGAVDNNDAKTVMGSIGLKPDDKTWINLIGFGGRENASTSVAGGSVLAGRKFGERLNTGFEFDYFNFDPVSGPSADLWSVGAWIWYEFNPKFGIALRGEYLDDPDGGGLKGITLPGRPGSAILSADPDGSLSSLTLTLNFSPAPNVRIQPEIRYDHTSYAGGFDGHRDRFIFGAGVSYLF
ncbi:MAG: outer membrane beta-barrel protein [Verrucomicrobiae bacterium]|nr:outer membrane beta-barrel protein [Verrucomicrobiae bacterium]